MTTALLLTIFLGSLVSGWHCALMCGGIAVAMENPVRIVTRRRLMLEQLVMHIGRIAMYAALGGLAGAVGAVLWQQRWMPVQRTLFVLAAVLLLVNAWWLAHGSRNANNRFEAWLAAATAGIWKKLTERLSAQGAVSGKLTTLHGRLLAGMVWGLVPCGLIYAVLPYALLSGGAAAGASLMLAFGLGTLPNLLLISGFSARLAGISHRDWARYLAAGLMAGTGLFGLYRAATLTDDMLRGGFCLTH